MVLSRVIPRADWRYLLEKEVPDEEVSYIENVPAAGVHAARDSVFHEIPGLEIKEQPDGNGTEKCKKCKKTSHTTDDCWIAHPEKKDERDIQIIISHAQWLLPFFVHKLKNIEEVW